MDKEEKELRSDAITKANRKKSYKKMKIKEGTKRHMIIELLREFDRPMSADESSLILYQRGKVKSSHRQGDSTAIIRDERRWNRDRR